MTATRRSFLTTSLRATLAAPAVMAMGERPTSGFAKVPALENLTPLDVFCRMRCSPPSATTTWWYSGHMIGRTEDERAMQIFSIVGASQSQITYLESGAIRYSMIEAGYYGDPDTGAIVDGAMTNRLTGKPITPEHYLSPQSLIFEPSGTIRPDMPELPPGLDFTGRMIGPDVKAGRAWMAEELYVKVYAAAAQPRVLTSLANFQASVADILKGGSFIPATFEYTTWNSFRPWMNMGGTRGSIMMRLNSAKLESWQDLPEALRSRILNDHPGAFFSV